MKEGTENGNDKRNVEWEEGKRWDKRWETDKEQNRTTAQPFIALGSYHGLLDVFSLFVTATKECETGNQKLQHKHPKMQEKKGPVQNGVQDVPRQTCQPMLNFNIVLLSHST